MLPNVNIFSGHQNIWNCNHYNLLSIPTIVDNNPSLVVINTKNVVNVKIYWITRENSLPLFVSLFHFLSKFCVIFSKFYNTLPAWSSTTLKFKAESSAALKFKHKSPNLDYQRWFNIIPLLSLFLLL